ncbi:MAG: UvrD-helicase domain-containing protein, partial [Candidatus Limnocylindrales bacterium]
MHPSVAERLARLSPDQHDAATAPPGPVLCVAPAGSGKTTTLVARVAWRIATGMLPERICALTFNRRAADELGERLGDALVPLGLEPGAVRVRTFHALGREILVDAGSSVDLVDRAELLAELAGRRLAPGELRRLDDAFSRLKLDAGADATTVVARIAEERAAGRAPSPVLGAFVAYEAALAARRALDFDDLVGHALDRLEANAGLLVRWRERCSAVLVDESQDLDRAQLRLALLLAAPANDIFMVGDDDQTIYAWRLADVRRILDLAARLPGLRRVDLVTNRRCPAAVVEHATRLVEHNRERFAKRIVARPDAVGGIILAADPADDVTRARRLLAAWAPALRASEPPSHAVLARTNAELAPYAAAALEAGLPYRAEADGLDALEDPAIDRLLDSLVPGSRAPVATLARLL